MATRPDPKQTPKLKKEIERAEMARRIIDNPLFKESTDAIAKEVFNKWIHTAPEDVATREWFHKYAVAGLHYVKSLEKHLQTGRMAGITLTQIEEAVKAARPTTRRKSNA